MGMKFTERKTPKAKGLTLSVIGQGRCFYKTDNYDNLEDALDDRELLMKVDVTMIDEDDDECLITNTIKDSETLKDQCFYTILGSGEIFADHKDTEVQPVEVELIAELSISKHS